MYIYLHNPPIILISELSPSHENDQLSLEDVFFKNIQPVTFKFINI